MARTDRVTLLGYDRWRDTQRTAIREKLQPSETYVLEYMALTLEML